MQTSSNRFYLYKLCFAAMLSASLVACGGGGSSAPTPPVTPPTPAPQPAPFDINVEFANYSKDLVDGQILPGYMAMQTSANSLKDRSAQFCGLDSPEANDLAAFQQSWKEFNSTWQSVQWIKVGAVSAENRAFRIQFWPDTNNAVSRGVESLLLEQQTVTAEFVANQNVGGQGIPALEYLLFPEDGAHSLLIASDKIKRCEVAIAIAQNLVNMTTEINTAWQISGGDYRAQVISGTGDFTSVKDVIEELVTNWLEHLELVKDEKILIPLGSASPGLFDLSEHSLSKESLASIVVNLETLRSVFTNKDGRGFDTIIADGLEQDAINTQMLDAINATLTRIEQINQNYTSYAALLADESGRLELNNLFNELRILRNILTTEFIQALDISIGFNSNDGD